MLYLTSSDPDDAIELFPLVLSCLGQIAEQFIRAGIEVTMEPQVDSTIYGREVIVVWHWRITSLGATSDTGYRTLHEALLAAVIYLVRNSEDPAGGVGRR